MNYKDWEDQVFSEIKEDSLWKIECYRLSLFVSDIGWHDVSKLVQDGRTIKLSDQLYRALGSIGANIAEGFSRGTGKDRARFYEYALGSARESRDWYYKGRHILEETVVVHRIKLLSQIIRLLLIMVPHQRGRKLHETEGPYYTVVDEEYLKSTDPTDLPNLLQNIPMP
ncbi:MAG: four helix bundle protein [Chloroflexota bacterium]